jgi:CRISPR-associated endoribonuclease Cas6
MRLKIALELQGDEPGLLPNNYQPELSSWIYKTLHFGNDSFVKWLRENGYLNRNNEYQLYTFSNLVLTDFRHNDDRLEILQPQTFFYLSILGKDEIQPHIEELFSGLEPRIGDKKSKVLFRVKAVERLEDPVFSSKMDLSCISPIVLVGDNLKKPEYLSPDKKDYGKLFLKNLMAKYALLVKQLPGSTGSGLQGLSELEFKLLNKPHSKVIKKSPGTPAQESIKAYSFDFSLKAPAELIRLGYFAGFGNHVTMGFGCCQVIGEF